MTAAPVDATNGHAILFHYRTATMLRGAKIPPTKPIINAIFLEIAIGRHHISRGMSRNVAHAQAPRFGGRWRDVKMNR